jgi:hypothetical protein
MFDLLLQLSLSAFYNVVVVVNGSGTGVQVICCRSVKDSKLCACV